MTTTTTDRQMASAVVAVAKASADFPAITELWETEAERFEYARNCIAEAIRYDNVSPEYITQNPVKVIKRDLEFAG